MTHPLVIDLRGISSAPGGPVLDDGGSPAGYFSGAAGLLGIDIWNDTVKNYFRLEEAEYSKAGSGSLAWVQIGIGPGSPPFSSLGLAMHGVAAAIRAHEDWNVEAYWRQIPRDLATDSEIAISQARETFVLGMPATQNASVNIELWAHPLLVLEVEGLVNLLQYYVDPDGPIVRAQLAVADSDFKPHEENLLWSQYLACKVRVNFAVTMWSPELVAWLSQLMILVARENMVGQKEILVGVSLVL